MEKCQIEILLCFGEGGPDSEVNMVVQIFGIFFLVLLISVGIIAVLRTVAKDGIGWLIGLVAYLVIQVFFAYVVIWVLNVLFALQIPYTQLTVCAVLVLMMIFGGGWPGKLDG